MEEKLKLLQQKLLEKYNQKTGKTHTDDDIRKIINSHNINNDVKSTFDQIIATNSNLELDNTLVYRKGFDFSTERENLKKALKKSRKNF